MSAAWDRRRVLRTAAGAGSLAAVGDLAFLSGLPPVAAEDVKVGPQHVRLQPEIEPLVRLLEETPRAQLVEKVGAEVRRGVTYPQVLAALMLAGVENIKPRPVGFKFHAVLVVNSAHQASVAPPESDRWLPIFWALDYFKDSQAADVREGDWTMAALPDSALPPAAQAEKRFIEAMDAWDEDGADVAITRIARSGNARDIYELFWRYGARDFRDIGHKAIFAANAWRTLQVIGWEHSEPIVRSLAFALLQRGNVNPAQADEPADRPWRANVKRAARVERKWMDGRADPAATAELLQVLRTSNADQAGEQVMALLLKGASLPSLWDAVLANAGELIMRQPGIVGIHCVTTANALRYASQATASDNTRVMMLLQAASFMTMFRDSMTARGKLAEAYVDQLKPAELKAGGPAAIEEIFATVSGDRMEAARKTLAYLQSGGSADELLTTARRLIFLKGSNSHDYKFCSAALEDFAHVSPGLRNQYLATSMFNLRGTEHKDNPIAARTRAALQG